MRPGDRELAIRLEDRLIAHSNNVRPLPGICESAARRVFLEQLVESIRRIRFIQRIRDRPLSGRREDPNDQLFDPLRAAILHQRDGDIEEAFWLIFLFVHFGKNPRGGWRFAREVYGRLGEGGRWDWVRVRSGTDGFREWLHAHEADLRRQGVPGGFGNHRKFQSLDAHSPDGTGATVETYVAWIHPPRTHQALIEEACQRAGGDPRRVFHDLYRSMGMVAGFGRLARFDYLTMIGKLGLAQIEPGSTYLQGASGPLSGARLLYGQTASAVTLDRWLIELGAEIHVGMQVLEDALCNWQKSPEEFQRFRV